MNFNSQSLKNILYFIYPKKCMFCSEIINIYEGDFICKYCNQDLPINLNPKESNISVLDYSDIIRDAILLMKYQNKKHFAKGFAILMQLQFDRVKTLDYDMVINVPMYYKKKRKRGYDQAEELAREFAILTKINFEPNNLSRTKNTIAQSRVSFEERKENVRGIFEVKNPTSIQGKNIILVDDIYTSGNTINQCAIVLNNAGAKNISYLTLSKVGK